MKFVSFALIGLVAILAIVAGVRAGMETLRFKIKQSLESSMEVKGIENCENKCEKSFNRFAYQIATSGNNQETFEFRACVIGCNQCGTDLSTPGTDPGNCFTSCKNFDWKSLGVVKGVIEPDKACIGGCIINLCQVACSNGTVDATETPQNQQYFWPNGGCSIKTAPYSQYLEYVPFNSPNTGQGGSSDAAACCSNALSLCQYVGDTTSTNYVNLLAKTGDYCSQFVPSQTNVEICNWFNNPQNCGNPSV